MRIASKRLAKELTELQTNGTPTGVEILRAEDLAEWTFSIQVLGESVFEGQTFALRFRFPANYPLESPEVIFLNDGYIVPE